MEAVPRMPMIWLDLKEAGDFHFQSAVKKFVLKNYGENPEAYNEELKKLELLRQNAIRVARDFEGCSVLRKYLGQLHYLQSRVPMGSGQEAAVAVTWTEIFSGKSVAHEDIKYEQACILYNLGALHSMLGAMDKRVSEEGMKVSCTHFQCAAGAFAYLREHFPQAFSVDMSRQILTLNVNLMLGQAQECLLEKSMLDNRKSFLVARISAQVVDYYKEACRALENPDTASLLGRIQKDWKKLVQMKIYYFAAVAHLHMGKQAEEQQKFGERVAYFQSALDKLNEAIKLAKGQPDTVQDALRFAMDVIGGKYNSAKKDNDFIYHEAVPALDTLQPVKGAPLVKPLPVNPTDPAVTGPDIFAKLVPMAAHEASSLYSEEKAKLLREMLAKIEDKNEVLDQFMDSMQLDPETVDNLDAYNHIPPQLMEKCAALSVRPDTVKNLVQSMQVLSGVFTDVEASLKDIRDLLEEDELQEQKLQETLGQAGAGPGPSVAKAELAEVRREWAKYMEVHEKASFTNSELHRAMNLHVGNLRLLSGPLDQVRAALPTPALTPEDKVVLQNLKRILAKVQEMRDQRVSLEQQLRELIQKDDITASLVTTDHSEMKKLFEEQLKKYDQLKVYLEQNLAAQDNVLRALTEANVQYAAVRRVLSELDQKWNSTLQTLVASYEAYEDLMKKSQEGKDFYADLESKVATLLERAQSICRAQEAARQQLLDRELKKKAPPPRPTAPKPLLSRREEGEAVEAGDTPEELRSLPPDMMVGPRLPDPFLGTTAPLHFSPGPFPSSTGPATHYLSGPLPPGTYSGPTQLMQPRAAVPMAPATVLYPAPAYTSELGLVPRSSPQHGIVSSPYAGVGPPQPVVGLPSAPPPQLSGPELAMTVRPATTTVDSIQAPISSHTAPRPNPTPALPQPCFPVPQPVPQSVPQPQPLPVPYTYSIGTKQPLPAPYTYSIGTKQHLTGPLPQHQFPPGIPTGFPVPRTGPQAQAQAQPQPQPQRPAFGPQPTQQPLPFQHPHLFPSQAPGILPPPPPPYHFTPQPGVLGQPPPTLHTQLYPGPSQDPLPPHSGALPFPSPGPPHPHPTLAYGPAPSPRPLGPQATPVSIRGPPPASQPTPSPHLVPSPAPSPGPGPVPSRPPTAEPPPCLRRGAAAADLLSSSPESQHGGTQPPGGGQPLLQPTKVDAAEGRRPQALRLIEQDPYEHPERLQQLQQELEAFRGQLGDAGALDATWRELQEAQEHDARGRSIAIARCYSLKNRHQDVMPYDSNRVVLRSGKDDYINASCVEGLSPYCPPLVATQAPLPGTAADFWLMVHEQKVSVIVMLVSEAEMEKQKVARYFPTERGQPMVHGALSVALSSIRTTETHVERVLSLQFRDQSLKRSLVHLHFPTWPELGLPDSPGNLLRFIQEVHAHYLHQRPLHTPIVVHCSSGVGRTGAFALLYAAVQEVEAGNGIPELPQLVRRMRQQRKHMLQEKLHLKFCHEALVRHVEQVLQRHGVPPPGKPVASVNISQKNHLPQDSQDLVLGGDVPISSIQATIAKLSIRPLGGLDSPAASLPGLVEPPGLPPASLPESTPVPSSSPPPLSSPLPEAPQPEEEPTVPEAPSLGPPSSSLELLASLTPEAFSLDSSLRGKQRMSKQNFLQAHNGQGLRAAQPTDDPLSLLDPLWTLNKT